jgi:hypothetical protein
MVLFFGLLSLEVFPERLVDELSNGSTAKHGQHAQTAHKL